MRVTGGGQRCEGVSGLKGNSIKVSNWNTGVMLKISKYTPLSYIRIPTYVQRGTCRDAKYCYPGCFCSPSHAPMVIYPPREGFFFF